MIHETEIQWESKEIVVSSESSSEVRFRVGLEGALVSVRELAWAVAVAVNLEVGHFGDGDPREGGVHVNAEGALELHLILRYLL